MENKTPEPLQRRPEARAFKIEDLLTDVRQGRVRIPPFQRALKWERKNALELLDSLYRGYPVGTLLFWETSALPSEMHFGAVTISAAARSDALWVVDGQQRIVSLARVLLSSEPDVDSFALYFDLEQALFLPPPSLAARSADPSRWLPLTEVLDSQRLMQWLLSKAPMPTQRTEHALQVGKRIREYDVPAYLVRSEREDTLREIFGRINSAGKRLEAPEVFDALHGARQGARPATMGQIGAELARLGFGVMEDKILYRLLRVLHGADANERLAEGPLRLTQAEAAEAYRITAEVAATVIQFIRQDVGIPHYSLLPYKQPLVTLGKFFHQFPTPHPRSRALLVRWLWRGILNGAHRGDTVSSLQALERIVSGNQDQSVQRLLAMVGERPKAEPDVGQRFNFRFAASKLQALALLDMKPRHLETGQILDMDALLATTPAHGLLPPLLSQDHQGLFQSVANRLVHPAEPGLRRTLCGVTDPLILASHGISLEAHRALREGNASQFLSLRTETLRPAMQRFFEHHARWDDLDRPSLTSLIVADGDD